MLTHVDTVPEHLAAEAVDAVATDLGLGAGQVAAACVEWDRLANLEGVLSAIRGHLPEAERLKISRCIRQIRKEQDEDKVLLNFGWSCALPAAGSPGNGCMKNMKNTNNA